MRRILNSGLTVAAYALLTTVGAVGVHAQSGDTVLIMDHEAAQVLAEIETRIVLMPPAEDDMLPVSATAVISINSAGSYVLGGNVFGVSGKHGIEIKKSNVTLDLNGYALIGTTGALGGIEAPSSVVNVKIHNGAIRGWGQRGIGGKLMTASEISDVRVGNCKWNGIHLGQGIIRNCTSRQNGNHGIEIKQGKSIVDSCTLENNGESGLYTQDQTVISNVVATGNANGVWVGDDASISNVQANENTVIFAKEQGGERIPALGFGFLVGERCTITGCTASNNTAYGFNADSSAVFTNCVAENNGNTGIYAGEGSSLKSCVVKFNGRDGITTGNGAVIESCVAVGNDTSDTSAHGIRCDNGAVVRNCVVRDHGYVGLSVREGSTVEGNQSSGNEWGLVVYRSGTRVDSNNLFNNNTGLYVSGDENFVIRNTLSNTTNFSFSGFDIVGPITSDVAGTGPWANLIMQVPAK